MATPRSAEEAAPPGRVAAPEHPTRRRRAVTGSGFAAGWPLLLVLAVQAGLSLRLLRADTAFEDEATYLWAGHLEWAHLLHGTAIPPFPTYFSGAPVIYPPLGALADSLGGLAAARALSLAMMLGATVLVWGTASRMYGRRAGFFAAALFAVLGPTLHLGAFATYDALSVLLVALAAWLALGAPPAGDATARMVAAGAVLALANAAAYSSVLFDLVVLLLVLLTSLPAGRRTAARRCATLLVVLAALLGAGLLIGGGGYLTGVKLTTLARAPGGDAPLTVLTDAWLWTGLVLVLAVSGIIVSWARREWAGRTWLLAVLAAAAVIGPLEQARLHTLASLNKHVGLGAWFAAIAAGYTIDRFIAAAPAGRSRAVTSAACVVALAFPASLGAAQSRAFSTDWPNATAFLAIFGPMADHSTGRLLVEDPAVARYYLGSGSQWQRWSSTRNIILPSGANVGGPSPSAGVTGDGNLKVFTHYLERGYFSYVALNFADTTALDHQLAHLMQHSPRYRTIQVVPYATESPPTEGTYVIWRREPHP